MLHHCDGREIKSAKREYIEEFSDLGLGRGHGIWKNGQFVFDWVLESEAGGRGEISLTTGVLGWFASAELKAEHGFTRVGYGGVSVIQYPDLNGTCSYCFEGFRLRQPIFLKIPAMEVFSDVPKAVTPFLDRMEA